MYDIYFGFNFAPKPYRYTCIWFGAKLKPEEFYVPVITAIGFYNRDPGFTNSNVPGKSSLRAPRCRWPAGERGWEVPRISLGLSGLLEKLPGKTTGLVV